MDETSYIRLSLQMKTAIDSLFQYWRVCSCCVLGRSVFSYFIRFINPYTGRLGARIELLEAGHVELSLRDKKANRNHLNSVHAIALCNLGEFCSGLVVLQGLGKSLRGIVTHIEADYHKKARGTLRAKCFYEMPDITQETELLICTEIFNEDTEHVCTVHARWKIGPLQ